MSAEVQTRTMKRYRTRGGGTTYVIQWPGWWRRYTWACHCGAPRSKHRLALRVARRRAYQHATRCTRPVKTERP